MTANATVMRVRRNPGGVDAYGDPVDSTEDRATLTGCIVAPAAISGFDPEIYDRGRSGVIVALTLLAPIDTDLVYTDQVEVDGTLFDIDGEVGRYRSPFSGWEAGLQVGLRRVQG